MKQVRGRVATTHPLSVYGGIVLAEGALQSMAEQLRLGNMPMNFNHNIDQPISAVVLDAGTERMDDGHIAVWVEFDVPEEEWDVVTRELAAAGAPGGFSFTGMTNFAGPSDAVITLAADAHHFSQQQIRDAADVFPDDYTVRLAKAYQFSSVPDASVYLSFAVSVAAEIPAHLLAELIMDSCKKLFKRDASNVYNLSIHCRPGELKAKVRIATDDPDAFTVAVKAASETLKAAALVEVSSEVEPYRG